MGLVVRFDRNVTKCRDGMSTGLQSCLSFQVVQDRNVLSVLNIEKILEKLKKNNELLELIQKVL